MPNAGVRQKRSFVRNAKNKYFEKIKSKHKFTCISLIQSVYLESRIHLISDEIKVVTCWDWVIGFKVTHFCTLLLETANTFSSLSIHVTCNDLFMNRFLLTCPKIVVFLNPIGFQIANK